MFLVSRWLLHGPGGPKAEISKLNPRQAGWLWSWLDILNPEGFF